MDQSTDVLTKHYRSLTDDELQHIAVTSDLTEVARRALCEELARRNLNDTDVSRYKAEQELDELARLDVLHQKLLRKKKRLKMYAYLCVFFAIVTFVLGIIQLSRGQKSVGVGMTLSVVIALPIVEIWLWVRWRFYKFALRP